MIYSENKRAENGETPITILGNAKPNGSTPEAEENAQGQGQGGRITNEISRVYLSSIDRAETQLTRFKNARSRNETHTQKGRTYLNMQNVGW